jgi:hypothetical protein
MNHPLPTLHQEAQGTRSTKKSHFASNHFANNLATQKHPFAKQTIIFQRKIVNEENDSQAQRKVILHQIILQKL